MLDLQNKAFCMDTCHLKNKTALKIVQGYFSDYDEVRSLGSVCRRLPCMLLNLAAVTSETWHAHGKVTDNKDVVITVYNSHSKKGNTDVILFIGSVTDDNLPDTITRIVEKPKKLFKKYFTPGTSAVVVHGDFGKAEYKTNERKTQNCLFDICCTPRKMTMLESFKTFRAQLSKKSAETTTIINLTPVFDN